ncbi:MAG: HD domain-containing protein [Epsilonproteobacteria bacterium]|nr:HD domain-containing protein [Campylobacterota bacterium]
MLHVKNSIFSKPFLKTLFWKQNSHHRHGVLVHTLRVVYYILKRRRFKMVLAGLLHDIGKPFVAYQKEEDIALGEYSFTDHEEMSYLIIKDWKFVSNYTKKLVRYHYLIRDIKKHEIKDPKRSKEKSEIWDGLSQAMRHDLRVFLLCDDAAKGKNS